MTSSVPYFLCRCCQQCQRARHRAFSTTLCRLSQARNSSYYDLLGIKQDATQEEIKQAFFFKSKKLHPDSDPANPDLHSQFVKLSEAYRVLSKQNSRRRYDSLRMAQKWGPASYGSRSQSDPFGFGDFAPRSKSKPDENTQYWQQFHQPSGPEFERRHGHNIRVFTYCVLLMLGSAMVHYVAYRKLKETHDRFMDDKDLLLTRIYNENKERARSMGIQKQHEVLRQKHAEFTERYRLSDVTGALDAVKDPSPPASTAK
ncbi:dnaJ homolog subfamily C member 4 [Elgaria multicarinata webbii]|uniref:dnaJ homolog subfamily C member 4 n=1 Tax=Elgaria multicarinata webbii TaxID=159646 RepID=UPI002FCCE85C